MIYTEANFNKKTILITGGAGFIGSNLALYFQDNFPQTKVVVFDCFRNEETFSHGQLKSLGHYKNLHGFKGDIIVGHINNKQDLALLADYKFDYIFHQAAISDTRVLDQEAVIKTNVNSFYELLNIAKKNNAKMIYASSAAVYGNLFIPQIVGVEQPENPYGFSKYVMDQITQSHIQEVAEMPIVGLRFFNVYGQKEYHKGRTASMVLQLGQQILAGKKVKLFEKSEAIYRDFVYIDDVIQANICATKPKKNGVYNVGTGQKYSFLELANILFEKLGVKESKVQFIKNPYSHGYQTHTQADITKTIAELDYHPKFSLEAGIAAYLPEIKRLFKSEVL